MRAPVETPWLRFDLHAFLRQMGHNGEVVLTYRARPEVATRQWWSVRWTDDYGHTHGTAASSLQLLLRRAAEQEMACEAQDAWEQGQR